MRVRCATCTTSQRVLETRHASGGGSSDANCSRDSGAPLRLTVRASGPPTDPPPATAGAPPSTSGAPPLLAHERAALGALPVGAMVARQLQPEGGTPAAPKVAPLHLYGAAAAAAAAAGSLTRPAPRPPGYVATMRMEDMLRAAMAAAEVAEGTPGGERAAEGGGAAGVRSEFANVLQVLLTMATATWYSLWPLLLGTHLWPLLLRYLLWPLLLRYLL